jgi:hypothetical protein
MKCFLFLVMLVYLSNTSAAQDKQEKEKHYFTELRTGNRYNAFNLEFSRRFLDYFSGNIIFAFYNTGVQGGISFHPLSFLYVQSLIGITGYRSEAVDAPQFKPDYVYSFAGGVRIPLGRSPVAFSFSYRTVTMVQKDYDPNGGFLPPDYTRQPRRTEKEQDSSVSVGIVLDF